MLVRDNAGVNFFQFFSMVVYCVYVFLCVSLSCSLALPLTLSLSLAHSLFFSYHLSLSPSHTLSLSDALSFSYSLFLYSFTLVLPIWSSVPPIARTAGQNSGLVIFSKIGADTLANSHDFAVTGEKVCVKGFIHARFKVRGCGCVCVCVCGCGCGCGCGWVHVLRG